MSGIARARKRARPMMGTIVEICLMNATEAADDLITATFERGESLAMDLSVFSQSSWLMRKNRGSKIESRPDFEALIDFAMTLQSESEGAFCIEDLEGRLNLTGLAKGYVVDQMAEFIQAKSLGVSGVINAGGDLFFLGEANRQITLRNQKLERNLGVSRRAVASSSPQSPNPSTKYWRSLVEKFRPEDTICVEAHSVCLADAMAKVILFGQDAVTKRLLKKYDVEYLVLHEEGQIECMERLS